VVTNLWLSNNRGGKKSQRTLKGGKGGGGTPGSESKGRLNYNVTQEERGGSGKESEERRTGPREEKRSEGSETGR